MSNSSINNTNSRSAPTCQVPVIFSLFAGLSPPTKLPVERDPRTPKATPRIHTLTISHDQKQARNLQATTRYVRGALFRPDPLATPPTNSTKPSLWGTFGRSTTIYESLFTNRYYAPRSSKSVSYRMSVARPFVNHSYSSPPYPTRVLLFRSPYALSRTSSMRVVKSNSPPRSGLVRRP